MRHLLRYRFSINAYRNIKEIIRKQNRQIIQDKKFNRITFEKNLRSLVIDVQNNQKKIKEKKKVYDKICLTSARPVETMLKEFLDKSSKYSQEQLSQTIQYLGNAYQLSLMDNGGHLDRFNHKLIESPMFDHAVEEVKYALGENLYIETKNITRILKGLINLNYLDYEILRLVGKKIQQRLGVAENQRFEFKQRLYQSEKSNYYKQSIINYDKSLLKNNELMDSFKFFHEKHIQILKREKSLEVKKNTFQNNAIYELVSGLVHEFDKLNRSVEKIIESIIAIRKQYKQLVTISNGQNVLRNPELNYQALLIQQKLLTIHLITMKDIQKPEVIGTKGAQQRRVQQIFKIFVKQFENEDIKKYLVKNDKQISLMKDLAQSSLKQFAELIETYAAYSNLTYRLYGSDSRSSLINIKWQRYFLQDSFYQSNLGVQSLFRKAYAQTQIFFLKHYNKIQEYFKQANPKSKIYLASAFIEMGLFEQANTYRKFINGIKQEGGVIRQLFLSIKIFNNSIQQGLVPTEKEHKSIIKALNQMIASEQYNPTIIQLCDTINYLYQMKLTSTFDQSLYQILLGKLVQEVKYYEQSPSSNKYLLEQAKRILFLEVNNQNSIQIFSEAENIIGEKANPFRKVLLQTFSQSKKLDTPYILTGLNENNEQSGLYIANFDNSSIDGKLINGHINAYCQRLKEKLGINILAVPLTKFVTIDYPKDISTVDPSKEIKISLNSADDILKTFSAYKARNLNKQVKFIKDVTSSLMKKLPDNLGTKKILRQLNKLAQLINREKDLVLENQLFMRKCQQLVQLQKIKKSFNLLPQQFLSVKRFKNNNQLINMIEYLLTVEEDVVAYINKLQQKIQSNKLPSNLSQFIGKRTSLQVLQDFESEKISTKIKSMAPQELINIAYLADNRYIEYQDWMQLIKSRFNYYELKLSNVRDITKSLIMRFCPRIKEEIVVLPTLEKQLAVPLFPVNWQTKYHYFTEQKQEKNQLESIAEDYRKTHSNQNEKGSHKNNLIVLIQNWKHSLKMNKSSQQIFNFLLNLEFIDNLIEQKLGKTSSSNQNIHFLERDPKQYFNYLSVKNEKHYLQSPYLQYIINKLEQQQELKQHVRQRKLSKTKLLSLYREGSISRKQYIKNVEEVDNKLINNLKNLKKKLLTHIEGPSILEDASKIVHLNKNLQTLERIVRKVDLYQIEEDDDFYFCNQNYEDTLKIKRSKAENNLIILRLLALRSKNIELTQSQKLFLDSWKKSVMNGIDNFETGKQFTKLSLSQLSQKDKNILFQDNTIILKKGKNLALSDVILELNNFFDLTIINRLQAEIQSEFFSSKFKIQKEIFLTSHNKFFRSLAFQAENAIFQEEAKLTDKDIQSIIEMSKVFKTQGLSDRFKYNQHYSQLREKLTSMNQSKFRTPLISEYLKQKDQEYYTNYFPVDVYSLKQQEREKLWKSVFQKEKKDVKKIEISKKIEELCINMMLIKLQTPPFFGHLILQILNHEQTDQFSKQKLLGYIQLFKVDLKLDSEDLYSLQKSESYKLQDIVGQMRNISNLNFTNQIYKKLF